MRFQLPPRANRCVGGAVRRASELRFARLRRAGGLVSYGASLSEAYRLAGIYVGKVLNDAKPVDLPVVQSTKIGEVPLVRSYVLRPQCPTTVVVSIRQPPPNSPLMWISTGQPRADGHEMVTGAFAP